ncbi:MAG: hypothetical protein NT013_23615 [Planctomycetia bacterium]|nr:hypothetical protein [Planctomycetia bacterium]
MRDSPVDLAINVVRSVAMNTPRPAYFANRVLRLATKTVLAQHCGTDALALLCVIAMTEDARRYRGPVTFWNEQLLPLVGFAKWERLDRARQALIDAGWLLYEPGGRHRAGRYRVTIPPDLEDLGDTAVDEGSTPLKGYRAGDQQGVELGIKPESKRVSSRSLAGDQQGEPSYLLPLPETSPSPSNGDGEGWKEIEKQLRDAHVREWCDAVRSARAAGCSLTEIQAVINYFREYRDAWELPEAALYRRVLNATPDQRADDPATWLPFSPSFVRREQSAKEAQQRTVEAQQKRLADAQRKLELQREDDERQRLEDAFGAECDRLTADDLRQISMQDSSLNAAIQWHRKGKSAGQDAKQQPHIRGLLLKWLAQRTPSESPSEPAISGDSSRSTLDDGDARSPPTQSNTPRKTERTPHANEMSALQSSLTSPSPSRNQ